MGLVPTVWHDITVVHVNPLVSATNVIWIPVDFVSFTIWISTAFPTVNPMPRVVPPDWRGVATVVTEEYVQKVFSVRAVLRMRTHATFAAALARRVWLRRVQKVGPLMLVMKQVPGRVYRFEAAGHLEHTACYAVINLSLQYHEYLNT